MSDANPNDAAVSDSTIKLPPSAQPSVNSTIEASGALPREELPGDVIGRYKLMEKIGEGGFGSVYVAEQREPVKRRVALKITKLGMDTKQVVARFEAERQALAMMDHPNIARALDAGATHSGRPYFVMELVRGVKITEYCDKNKLATVKRLELFIQVCRAVEHAHQKGVIHRDIKPSNILVTVNEGVALPKVIDFGIAKAAQGSLTDKTVYTQFDQFMGTPAYMSPEQADMTGQDVDTRTDIYSLGVLLYELLTSQTPFGSRNLLERGFDEMRRIIREMEPQLPSMKIGAQTDDQKTSTATRHGTDSFKLIRMVRGDLDWVVMKCLEKDRSRRYETASKLADDVQRFLDSEPVTARPPSKWYRFTRMARRNRVAFGAAAAIFVSLVIALMITTWFVIEEKRERMLAEEAMKRADSSRAAAEASREQADVARGQSDLERKEADAARDKAETALLQSEADRIKAQDAKQKAEEAQKQTEAALAQSEADRTKAIIAEQKARDSETQAETARQATEGAVKRAESAESAQAAEVAKEEDAAKALANANTMRQRATQARQRAEAETRMAVAEANQWRDAASNYLARLDELLPAEALRSAAIFCPPADEKQPWAERFLGRLGAWHARTGDWTNAAADYSTLLDREPDEPLAYEAMGPLLLKMGQGGAYSNLSAKFVAQFSKTENTALRRFLVRGCLLGPIDAKTAVVVTKLAQESGTMFVGWSDYRIGDYAGSSNLLTRALVAPTPNPARDVQIYSVLAMADKHLMQNAAAHEALASARQIMETKLPSLESGDIGRMWVEWLITRELLDEAEKTVEAK